MIPHRTAVPTLDDLLDFIEHHPRLLVLTGAGISTGSGIPDYRDAEGAWKRTPPVMYQAFMGQHPVRQRYWARSLVGWPIFQRARPSPGHHALAGLQASGYITRLVTQNVDGLHQQAGSRDVIDLHGRLDQVRCMGCGELTSRMDFQSRLAACNPLFAGLDALAAPDGDAELDDIDFSTFDVPGCHACGGILKPHVVFYGENVPLDRPRAALEALARSDALLVVGSSLMVRSGLRHVEAAIAQAKPVAAINLGKTRADDLLALRVALPSDEVLVQLLERLGRQPATGEPKLRPALPNTR